MSSPCTQTAQIGDDIGGAIPPTRRRRQQQQRAIDTRRSIIEAALHVFADVGFDRATTRAISEVAEVPQPLLIYHFKTKDALWREATASIFKEVQAEWRENADRLATLDPLERLRIEFKRLYHATLARPHFHQIMVTEGATDTPRRSWVVDQHLRPMLDHVRPDILAAQATGDLPPGDLASLFCVMMALSTSLVTFGARIAAATGEPLFEPDRVEAHWALIERAFFKK